MNTKNEDRQDRLLHKSNVYAGHRFRTRHRIQRHYKSHKQIQFNSRFEIPVQYPPLVTELDGPQQAEKMLLCVGQTY